jgi:hypothetical protein
MIFVQHIETTWYKHERGAQHGTLKNKLPAALPIPALTSICASAPVVVQTVKMSRQTSLVSESVAPNELERLLFGWVEIEPSPDRATVRLRWDAGTGKPIRWQWLHRIEPWQIEKGQWARVRFNGRCVLEATWQYHVTTVNVGVAESPEHNWFLSSSPDYRIESLPRLN